MRHHTHPLLIPDTATDEIAADGVLVISPVARFVEKSVQVTFIGLIDADISLEGTIDGVGWVELSAVTQSSIIYVQPSVVALRLRVSNWVSGTFSAMFAGFDPRVGY